MRPPTTRIIQGEARAILRTLEAESVACCITSPPYFGLRAYGTTPAVWADGWKGELGQEPTVELYIDHLIEVFGEVHRVLRKDGTCWIVIGSSYINKNDALIPQRLALALQEPRQTSHIIKRPEDRAWLAALVDGEGCISIKGCPSYSNKPDSPKCNEQYTPFICIGNNDRELLDHCVEITGLGTVGLKQAPTTDRRGINSRRQNYGWRLEATKAMGVICDIYPYLIVKRKQAILACTLDQSNKNGRSLRGNGVLPEEEQQKRRHLKELVNRCNQRETIDLPSWCVEPFPRVQPSWIVRSIFPWIKRNSLPESVVDRPTNALEWVLLCSKGPSYYWDAEAIRIPQKPISIALDLSGARKRSRDKHFAAGIKHSDPSMPSHHGTMNGNPAGRNRRNTDWWFDSLRLQRDALLAEAGRLEHLLREGGPLADEEGELLGLDVNTKGYPHAHFATFSEDLVVPMILAGSPPCCCPECGSPWRRVTAKEPGQQGATPKLKALAETMGLSSGNGTGTSTLGIGGGGHGAAWAEKGTKVVDLGWEPTCKHPHERDEAIPTTVLDCFAGTFTVGAVALRLGRAAIGIELNSSYVDLARGRVGSETAPLLGLET